MNIRFPHQALIPILIVSALVLGLPSPVHSVTIRVPQDQPTIQQAINMANPGDTVLVSSGTYLENLVIKKQLHLVGAPRTSTIIDGQGLGTVVWVNSSTVEIRGFTIRNPDSSGWVVHVEQANGVNITGNIISGSPQGDGVNLYRANNTLVSGNILTMNLYGVNVTDSQSDRIVNNESVASNATGIQLKYSTKSLVFNNTLLGGEDGVDLEGASQNNVTRNFIKGTLDFGIHLTTAGPNPPCQNNIIVENTLQRSHYIGIGLQNASLNTFYHNDFFISGFRHVNLIYPIDSQNNWDNSTLGAVRPGGNYWDNYTGIDTNNDGIGDTNLPANGVDRYPLTAPFRPVPVLVQSILASPAGGSLPLTVTFTAQAVGTLTPFTYFWDFGDGSAKSSLASPVHSYGKVGNYTVMLTITDSSGSSDSSRMRILVTPGSGNLSLITLSVVVIGIGAVEGFLVWRRRRKKLGSGETRS